MKKLRGLSFLLLIILITPIVVVTFSQLDFSKDIFALYSEIGEEKETETKELINGIKEFVLCDYRSPLYLKEIALEFFSFNKKIMAISQDVSTPPPEIS